MLYVDFPIHRIALTKLDILDELPELKICTAYKLRGERLDRYPASEAELRMVEVTVVANILNLLKFFLRIWI